MRLKSLEIMGFKSFPDKVKMNFVPGITAAVGPNGSGKSNISDAVRWVLGEQATRILRIKSMEDVIFGGTSQRKALGFAEVVLTIDNTDRGLDFDSDEVAVTRRYYRSGDSEYKINGKPVRLKDINELFMDTGMGRDGYSIIGQGKVADVVNARSEERRSIFEEAAGISKYRYRKQEAERNLARAEDNLVHLDVIMSELEGRVEPLRRDAEKTKQYLELMEQKKSVEIGLWLSTLTKSAELLRDWDYKEMLARSQQEEIDSAIQQIEADIEQKFTHSNQLAAQRDEMMRHSAELEESAAKIDGEAAVLENDISHRKERIERLTAEIEAVERTGDGMQLEIEEKQLEIEQKKIQLAEKQTIAEEMKIQLESLRTDDSEFSRKISELMTRRSEITSELAAAQVELASAQSQIGEITARLENVDSEIERRQLEIEKLESGKKLTEDAIVGAEARLVEIDGEIEEMRRKLQALREQGANVKRDSENSELDAKAHERKARILEDLEKSMEGFAGSVRSVMKMAENGTLKGIHGPVSRLIDVPSEYATAIEIALGGNMQNIVVDNEDDAKRAIAQLKQSKAGRATFLPLTTIKPARFSENGLSDCEGYIGIAAELVKYDSKYANIISNALGKICVVRDIDCAVAIARKYSYRFRIVTLDGQVVNAGGSMTGGSLAKNAGLLARKGEIEALRKKSADCMKKCESLREKFAELEQEAAKVKADIQENNEKRQVVSNDKIRFESDLKNCIANIETLTEEAARLINERGSAGERTDSLNESIAAAEEKINVLNKQLADTESEITGSNDIRAEASRKREELSASLSDTSMAVMSLSKDIEAAGNSIRDMESRRSEQAQRMDGMREEIQNLAAENEQTIGRAAQMRKNAEQSRADALSSREGMSELAKQREQTEREIHELRRQSKEKSEQREAITGEVTRLEERRVAAQKEYDEIIMKLLEEYNLTRREAEAQFEKAENPREADRRVKELRSAMKKLEPVNLGAVEEYKEVFEKYTMYKTQIADVQKSKSELNKLIETLTEQMKELFVLKFDEINKHFKSIFTELFGGGSGYLELTDREDVLNCGIEIHAQPPGKTIKNIDLFSGGEKTVIAVAIYFAIMKVNPSPFCILDEIDSALDERNVDNIAEYCRRMSGSTQYIIITHRRGTMEVANMIYGITMQQDGVSKLLELNIDEISDKLGVD